MSNEKICNLTIVCTSDLTSCRSPHTDEDCKQERLYWVGDDGRFGREPESHVSTQVFRVQSPLET